MSNIYNGCPKSSWSKIEKKKPLNHVQQSSPSTLAMGATWSMSLGKRKNIGSRKLVIGKSASYQDEKDNFCKWFLLDKKHTGQSSKSENIVKIERIEHYIDMESDKSVPPN